MPFSNAIGALTSCPSTHSVMWIQVQEASLEHYVQQAMPSSHPMFPFVSQSLQMLQHNPNWDQQKKSEYMWRLIKDLS